MGRLVPWMGRGGGAEGDKGRKAATALPQMTAGGGGCAPSFENVGGAA